MKFTRAEHNAVHRAVRLAGVADEPITIADGPDELVLGMDLPTNRTLLVENTMNRIEAGLACLGFCLTSWSAKAVFDKDGQLGSRCYLCICRIPHRRQNHRIGRNSQTASDTLHNIEQGIQTRLL